MGLHAECDVHGTRLLQRYIDHRQLARLAGQIGMRKRNDTTPETLPVDPRQVASRTLRLGTFMCPCDCVHELVQKIVSEIWHPCLHAYLQLMSSWLVHHLLLTPRIELVCPPAVGKFPGGDFAALSAQ